jgi:hypothetical protein
VSYRNGCFRKTRGLRIRPVPEMEFCLVYTPRKPDLYTLNATAWLILELCDGRSFKDLAAAFHSSVEPLMSKIEAGEYLLASLRDLTEKSIVKFVPKPIVRQVQPEGESVP